ncbi:MAG: type II toxin-antitoxin system CcdA family antitoxin [Fluviibacter sp.]
MSHLYDVAAKKGRLTLSVNQDLLDKLEPYKQQVNLSAQAEMLFADMLVRLEHRAWVERNDSALRQHGADIAQSGLAGTEFNRV